MPKGAFEAEETAALFLALPASREGYQKDSPKNSRVWFCPPLEGHSVFVVTVKSQQVSWKKGFARNTNLSQSHTYSDPYMSAIYIFMFVSCHCCCFDISFLSSWLYSSCDFYGHVKQSKHSELGSRRQTRINL